MHTRERGAAHVNVFFFLVMLVLFLAAVGFGYVQQAEATKLSERIETLSARNVQLEHDAFVYGHYVEDVAKVVGETGQYAGREGFVYDLDEGVTKKVLEGVTVPSRVQSLVATFAKEMKIPESTATPLESLLNGVTQEFQKVQKELADQVQANEVLAAGRAALEKSVADANRQKSDEVAKLNEQLTDLQQSFESSKNALNQQIDSLRDTVRARGEALDEEKAARAEEATVARQESNELKGRIDALAQSLSLRNPPQQPDGAVISSSQAAGKAWIDLGRKDMLPLGTVFEITSPDTGDLKARGRVVDLEFHDRAEVELFDVADRFDYVVKGDLVRNDLYSADMRRNIYLMGRFGFPMTRDLVKASLERLGNRVHDKIGPGVDLVIVGGDTLSEETGGFTPITESEEYKDALRLGIELAPINKVRSFLVLSGE